MAYNKTVWTNGATALSAENFNHMENGIEDLDTGKVDKEAGKGLSTNDYTTNEKNKLAGIAAGAQVNPGNATTSAAGLMSAADKTKLNGIATGAEVNQNAFSNVKVGSTTIAADSKTDTLTLAAGSNVTLTPDATNDKVTIAAIDTTYSNATTSAAGLMSAADKTKLNKYDSAFNGNFALTSSTVTFSLASPLIKNSTITVNKSGWYPLTISGWFMSDSDDMLITPKVLRLSSRAVGSATIEYTVRAQEAVQGVTLTVEVLWCKN